MVPYSIKSNLFLIYNEIFNKFVNTIYLLSKLTKKIQLLLVSQVIDPKFINVKSLLRNNVSLLAKLKTILFCTT